MTWIPENGWGERIRAKIIILKLQILFKILGVLRKHSVKLSITSKTTYKLKKTLQNPQFINIKLICKDYPDTYQQILQCISIGRLKSKIA